RLAATPDALIAVTPRHPKCGWPNAPRGCRRWIAPTGRACDVSRANPASGGSLRERRPRDESAPSTAVGAAVSASTAAPMAADWRLRVATLDGMRFLVGSVVARLAASTRWRQVGGLL